MLLDYWLAGRFGQLWLRLHRALRTSLGELPAECVLVSGGQLVSAARLYRVQSFAVRVWWRAGMTVFVLLTPAGAGVVALFPGRIGTDIGVALVLGAGCAAATAMAQMGLINYRSGQTRLYLLRTGPQAGEEPLPTGSPGLPTSWDFWAILIIALAAFGILSYAGLH